uniref:Uncharacterized protein n=1 Tax=Arundo donax TaxID=35708 RepID=A0A0A9DI94_ARUDO
MTYQSRKTETLSSARALAVDSQRGTDNLALFGSTLPHLQYYILKPAKEKEKKRNKRFPLFSISWLPSLTPVLQVHKSRCLSFFSQDEKNIEISCWLAANCIAFAFIIMCF